MGNRYPFRKLIKTAQLRNLFHYGWLQSILVALLLLSFSSAHGEEKVKLLLKWRHQFQFAGYYMALEKGYYKEAGIVVEIKEAESEAYTIQKVVEGEYDFGIANSGIVVHYLNGEPVVVLAAICQRSPSVLLVKKSSGITSAKDLLNKTIMLGETAYAGEIYALLKASGLSENNYKVVTPSFSLNELLSGKIDALNGYLSNEPYFLQKFDIDYITLSPEDEGINFYSDCLFSSQSYVKKNAKTSAKFLEASLKGWQYALSHQEETANLILEKYNPSKIKEHLLFEAEILHSMVMPDIIEIGHMDRTRWDSIAHTFVKLGLAKTMKPLDDFLYTPMQNRDSGASATTTIILAACLLILVLVSSYCIISRQKVRKELRRALALFKIERRDKEKATSELLETRTQLSLHLHEGKKFAEQRDVFLANLSHEIRTPMNAIVGFSNLVQKGQIDEDKYHEVFEIIQKNSLNLLKVIDNLVDLSKIQTGTLKIAATRVSISKLLDESINFLHEDLLPNMRDKVKFKVETPPHSIFIRTDEKRLKQAICGLASSFSRILEEGEIKIFIKEEGGNLLFVLREENKEISENEMRQLIEDQNIYTDSFQPLSEGISLNISLSREIIKLLNGNLWYEISRDNGTSIYISIPFVAMPPQKLSNSESIQPYKMLDNLVVLVVEDDQSNSLLLKAMLEKRGATVIIARNGREAINLALNNSQIKIVLMDIKLPEVNGLEATKAIKKEKPNLPIIAQTAYAMEEDRYRCLEAGCDDYIVKPIIQEELFQKLQEFSKKGL